jgi:hypothetical protein
MEFDNAPLELQFSEQAHQLLILHLHLLLSSFLSCFHSSLFLVIKLQRESTPGNRQELQFVSALVPVLVRPVVDFDFSSSSQLSRGLPGQ